MSPEEEVDVDHQPFPERLQRMRQQYYDQVNELFLVANNMGLQIAFDPAQEDDPLLRPHERNRIIEAEFQVDHRDRLPISNEELGIDEVLFESETGERHAQIGEYFDGEPMHVRIAHLPQSVYGENAIDIRLAFLTTGEELSHGVMSPRGEVKFGDAESVFEYIGQKARQNVLRQHVSSETSTSK